MLVEPDNSRGLLTLRKRLGRQAACRYITEPNGKAEEAEKRGGDTGPQRSITPFRRKKKKREVTTKSPTKRRKGGKDKKTENGKK